ncbi:MAG: hypothetical protein JXB35_10865 [Anaerolineae bacterium]|nr:hypothetical protein [Anaerolineae bacterium]
MTALKIVISILLLVSGRQLFWLFVGSVGFVSAIEVITRWVVGWPGWLTLVVALAAGVVGAVLAIFLQEVAVGIAGFLGGGYIVLSFLDIVGINVPLLTWVLALVGGIIGLLVTVSLFDWSLIVLSSLSGASLLVRSLPLSQPWNLVVFVGLLAVGLLIQARLMHRQELASRPSNG